MTASQFAKAQKLFDRLKELDAEILECEKYADMIANKKMEIKLSLKMNDLEAAEKEKHKVCFDGDGSLMSNYHRAYMSGLFGIMTPAANEKEKKYTDKYDSQIPDRVALKVLGVLLADKLEARELAIKALGKMGINI